MASFDGDSVAPSLDGNSLVVSRYGDSLLAFSAIDLVVASLDGVLLEAS